MLFSCLKMDICKWMDQLGGSFQSSIEGRLQNSHNHHVYSISWFSIRFNIYYFQICIYNLAFSKYHFTNNEVIIFVNNIFEHYLYLTFKAFNNAPWAAGIHLTLLFSMFLVHYV